VVRMYYSIETGSCHGGMYKQGSALVGSRSCTEASPERFPGGEQQWVYSLQHGLNADAKELSRRSFPAAQSMPLFQTYGPVPRKPLHTHSRRECVCKGFQTVEVLHTSNTCATV
jgi:hypothetical protein